MKNLSNEYLHVNIAVSVLATAAIILRFFARWRKGIVFGLDDVLILIGWFFLIGVNVSGGIMFKEAAFLGPETSVLSPPGQYTMFKAFYALQIIYYLCMLPTKLSILALYWRIFSTKHYRIVVYVGAVICIIWAIAGLFPTIFMCNPIPYYWDRDNITGTCIDFQPIFAGITVANFLTDVMILLMPMYMIYGLQLTRKQKIAAAMIFLAGSTACICALIRAVSQNKFGLDTISLVVDCGLWVTIEPALAIISACLPSLKHFLPTSDLKAWYLSHSGTQPESTTTSKKSRGSWFALDLGRSPSTRARHGTTTTASRVDPEHVYSLRALHPYDSHQDYSDHKPSKDKQSSYSHDWGRVLPPLNAIHVRNDFAVDNESLRE